LLTIPDLKALTDLLGYRGPSHKYELVNVVTGHLADPANLRSELDRLPELERAAVAEAVHSGDGRVSAGRFRAKYGATPDSGSRLRLFFLGQGQISPDLCALLADLIEAPADAELKGGAELVPSAGLQLRLMESAAQADLSAVLRLVQAGGLRCSDRTKRPTQATVEAVAEVLSAGEIYSGLRGAIAAFAWPLLLQAGGLAELAGTKLQLTARGRAALTRPSAPTIRSLWQRWLSHGLLDEFSRIEEIKGQSVRGALTKVGPRRLVVAEGLAHCPLGQWIAVDDFFRYLEAEQVDPYVARDPWKLYIGDRQYGSLGYQGHHSWAVLQGRYVLCLIFEYAATLGLVDVAYVDPEAARDDYHDNWGADDLDALSRYDGLRHFRVNQLGAYGLGLIPEYVAPPSAGVAQSLRVQANFEVVAPDGLDPAGLMLLKVYAEPRGEVVWRISRDRLLVAIEGGHDPAELVAFLEARSGAKLPNPVAALIKDSVTAAGRLQDLGRVRLVEVRDRALLTLISRDPRLAGLCQRRGESYLAVPLERERAFLKELRSLGYPLRPSR